MAGDYECPHCGADISDIVAQAVAEHLAEKRPTGTVEDEAERSRNRMPDTHAGRPLNTPQSVLTAMAHVFTPAMALLLIGAILVVCAVVILVASVWEGIGGLGRLTVVALPAVLSYGIGGWLERRDAASPWVVSLLGMVGSSIAPFAVWLAIGAAVGTNPRGDEDACRVAIAAFGGLVIQVAALAWLRSAVLTAPAAITTVYMAGAIGECVWPNARSGAPISIAIALSGAVLMVCGQVFDLRRLENYGRWPHLIGVVALLLGFSILGTELGALWDVLAALVPLVLILAASRPRFAVYLWPAAVFLVISIFRIGGQRFADTAGVPLTLLLCGVASMVVGYVVHRIRNQQQSGKAGTD
jgi:hypothetical protein